MTTANALTAMLAKARIEGAQEERGRIIAAVEAERRQWMGKYGHYRDVRVDAIWLLLDVLSHLPLAAVSVQERGGRDE